MSSINLVSDVDERNIHFVTDYPQYKSAQEYFADKSPALRSKIGQAIDQGKYRSVVDRLVNAMFAGEGFNQARITAQNMAAKVRRSVGREDVAEKLADCFQSGRLEIYEHGRKYQPYDACGFGKICPFHAKSESKRRLGKYLFHVQESAKKYRLKHITFTMPNVPPGSLGKGWLNLWGKWTSLRRSVAWDPVTASMANIETTWNSDMGAFNLHLHVLVAIKWNENFDYTGIRRKWVFHVHFQDVKGDDLEKALKELVKYPTKLKGGPGQGGGLLDMPDSAFAEWWQVFWGARTLRTYGDWFRIDEPGDVLGDESPYLGELVAEYSWKWSGGVTDVILIQVYNSTEKLLESLEYISKNRGKPPGGPPAG